MTNAFSTGGIAGQERIALTLREWERLSKNKKNAKIPVREKFTVARRFEYGKFPAQG
jgi:hypothetical protein